MEHLVQANKFWKICHIRGGEQEGSKNWIFQYKKTISLCDYRMN